MRGARGGYAVLCERMRQAGAVAPFSETPVSRAPRAIAAAHARYEDGRPRPLSAQSAKGDAMRTMIRASFKANVGVEDEVEINKLKMRAILGIQNYVIHESTRKAMARRRKP